MSEIVEQSADITDEDLESLRAFLGKPVRRGQPFIEALTTDSIRHYSDGIGDNNPLWVDRAYAASSCHGRVLAPPTILFAMDRNMSGYVGGLPGVHGMFAGAHMVFSRPLGEGDELRGSAKLTGLEEKATKFAGRAVKQTYEIEFRDQSDHVAARASQWAFRHGRSAARSAGKYTGEGVTVRTWTPDEIAEIAERYRTQESARRGNRPLALSAMRPGDLLPEILKGPYTATTAIAFVRGWGGVYVAAHGGAMSMYERHPALAIPNEYGVPEPPERVHWDNEMAQQVGVPLAYDYGPERVAWLGHVVTDWMGDAALLKELYVEVRRHNLLGDLVTNRGRVAHVDEANQEVRVLLEAVNQRGETVAQGWAVVKPDWRQTRPSERSMQAG